MEISDNGLEFLKREEGEKLTVYRDSRGLPTVGVGHLVLPIDNLKVGDTITQDQVDDLLRHDLEIVYHCIENVVTAALNQNQFDALCSLIFNIGTRAFAGSHSVLQNLNIGYYQACADGFLDWRNAGGKPILLARRQRERALFLTLMEETNG